MEDNNHQEEKKEQGDFQPTLETQKKTEQLYERKKGAVLPDNHLLDDTQKHSFVENDILAEKSLKGEFDGKKENEKESMTGIWIFFLIFFALMIISAILKLSKIFTIFFGVIGIGLVIYLLIKMNKQNDL